MMVTGSGKANASCRSKASPELLIASINPAVSSDTGARSSLTLAAETGAVSGRGITRLIRVARTIADLELSHDVRSEHIDEAYSLRAPERAGAMA